MAAPDRPLNQVYGNEIRQTILPTSEPTGIGFLGPAYDPADEIMLPNQIGVRNEGTLGATMDAAKAVAWYADMIGFGGPTSELTRSMGTKPYPVGVNYFLRTSQKCSNGQDMWEYVEGIPTGEAMGKRIKQALEGMGYPSLKGLAPGMIEDVQKAFNPEPVVKALFGSAYPICKQERKRVGSALNKLAADDGAPYVENPGSVEYVNGVPYQTHWVLDRYVTRAVWEADKGRRMTAMTASEGWANQKNQAAALGFTAAALLAIAVVARVLRN